MEQKTSAPKRNPQNATGTDYSKRGATVLIDYSSKGKKKRFWFF